MLVNTYFSPTGNPEVWKEKPEDYFTIEEWNALNPPVEPEVIPLTLEEQLVIIDNETSDAITSGFDHKLEGYDIYHFSYDPTDQQNFADAVNIATLLKLGLPGLPETVDWNAWIITKDEEGNIISHEMIRINLTPELLFDLYGAAMIHKTTQLEIGSLKKQALIDSYKEKEKEEEIVVDEESKEPVEESTEENPE